MRIDAFNRIGCRTSSFPVIAQNSAKNIKKQAVTENADTLSGIWSQNWILKLNLTMMDIGWIRSLCCMRSISGTELFEWSGSRTLHRVQSELPHVRSHYLLLCSDGTYVAGQLDFSELIRYLPWQKSFCLSIHWASLSKRMPIRLWIVWWWVRISIVRI